MAANGNGHAATGETMARVFPEALTPLQQADPEVYAILQDEKKRQWCVFVSFARAAAAGADAGHERRPPTPLCTPAHPPPCPPNPPSPLTGRASS
jgi:hypothetical protein